VSESPLVSLRGVRKSFPGAKGPVEVLKGISFDVHAGEVVCLIGPSGSGKSTTLRTINALETIQSGTVRVCGLDYQTSGLAAHQIRRHTAMIFQRFELFPHLTARQNVAIAPIKVLGKSQKDGEALADDLLARVGLAEHGDKYPAALSGGQQQRVAIARALAIDPKVLLCDEPTSALDPELVHEVLEILIAIARKGMTMLVVTHELSFAERVSNRCLFLDHGEVVEEAPTCDFFHHPKSPRLGDFLRRVRPA
jgi:ABC-type polar amino acid transport system ATPase subunit